MGLDALSKAQLIDEVNRLNKIVDAQKNKRVLDSLVDNEREKIENWQKLLTSILALSRDGLVIVDEKQAIFAIDPLAESLFGRSSKEVLGNSFGIFLPEEDRARVLENWFNLDPPDQDRPTQNSFNAITFEHNDGGKFSADVSISSYQIDNRKTYSISIHKISKDLNPERKGSQIEKRLSIALQATQMGVWEWDLKTDKIYWSPQVGKIVGIQAGANSLEDFTKFVHPDDLDELMKATQKAIDDREILIFEFRILGPEGEVKWMRDYAQAEYNQKGEAQRLIGTVEDITERKKNQLDLQKSENHLHSVIRSIPDLVWMKDPEGVYLACNERFELLFGATEDEIQGKTDYDFVDKELADFFRGKDAEAIQVGEASINEEVVRFASDGHEEILETIKTPIFDKNGKLTGVLGIGRDITQRKQAELALKESEQKFRYIFDNSIVAKSITTPDGKLNVNKAFYSMLGYTQEEFQNTNWQEITHPDDLELSKKCADAILNGEKESLRFLKRYIHKNGKTVWVNNNLILRRDESGKPMYFLVTALDITEQKEAEEALRESKRRLSTLMHNLPGMAYRCKNDRNWSMEFVSGGCKNLTGYEPEAMINNKDIAFGELIHPEDQAYVWDVVKQALKGKNPFEIIYRIKTASGDIKWVWERGQRVNSGNDSMEVLEGFITDITEKKQAEDLLRASEERYRRTLDNMMEGCQILDHEYRYIYVNDTVASHGKTTRQALLGHTMMEVYPGIEQTEMFLNLRRCMNDREAIVMENEFQFPDGSRGWFNLSMEPVPQGVFILSIDITYRKLAERELIESEMRYRGLFENSPDALFINLNEKIVLVNQACLRLFGAENEDEILGKSPFEIFHPDFHDQLRDRIRKVRELGEVVPVWDLSIKTLSGKSVPVEARATAFELNQGRAIQVILRDTSFRRQAEDAVRTSEHKLRLFVEHAPASLAMYDTNMCYLVASRRWLIDYGLGDVDLTGKSHYEIFPEIPENWKEFHRRGLNGEVIKMEEDRFERDDGSFQWLRWEIRPWYKTDNQIGGIVVFTEDISEGILNKQISDSRLHLMEFAGDHSMDELIEETLNEAEKITGSKIGFYHFLEKDQETLLLQNWSTATKEVFCKAKDAKGLHYSVDQAGVWADCIRQKKAIIHNDYASVPNKKGMPDGHAIVLREVVVPVIRNNKITSILGVGNKETHYSKQDVSIIQEIADYTWEMLERKRAEENLRESEMKYRQLIQHSGDAIFLFANDKYELMNAKYEEIFGITFEDVQREGFNILDHVAPKSRDLVAGRLNNVSEGQENTPNFEFTIINGEGKEIQIEAHTSYMRYQGGFAVQGILRDITMRKNLEEQLRQAQKMEAIGSLAGGVAHDFNNLLTIINGYSDLLMDSDILEKDKPLIEEIRAAGNRASRLTNQLLAFSRKQIIQPKVINLNVLILEQMKMLGRLVGEDIEVSTIFPQEIPNIKADPGQIEQIIMNLVVNGRDAMPLGGKLTIEIKQVEFDEYYAASHADLLSGKFVMIAVSDTGKGMDKLTQSRIFEPFFTTKGRGKGTGLGLATVYGIIKQSGGGIHVYSELGIGTTFKIYFPVVEEKLPEIKAKSKHPELKGDETILVVEDDVGVMKLTKATLQSYGYQVLTAINGEEGLRVFGEHKQSISLLISDVIMPLMGGNEMVKRIKQISPKLKVIFFSGYIDDSLINDAVMKEGVEFIQKPFSQLELVKAVRKVLDQ